MPMATIVAPDTSQRNCSVPRTEDATRQSDARVLVFESGPEVRRIARQSDRTRRNRKWRAERKLPDKKKGNQPAQTMRAVNLAQIAYDPPEPGMAAPSSAHTRPSQMANTAPRIQPSIACGPPIAPTIRGMVMNGPTPIMSIMFSAVALPTPIPRIESAASCVRRSLVVGRRHCALVRKRVSSVILCSSVVRAPKT